MVNWTFVNSNLAKITYNDCINTNEFFFKFGNMTSLGDAFFIMNHGNIRHCTMVGIIS